MPLSASSSPCEPVARNMNASDPVAMPPLPLAQKEICGNAVAGAREALVVPQGTCMSASTACTPTEVRTVRADSVHGKISASDLPKHQDRDQQPSLESWCPSDRHCQGKPSEFGRAPEVVSLDGRAQSPVAATSPARPPKLRPATSRRSGVQFPWAKIAWSPSCPVSPMWSPVMRTRVRSPSACPHLQIYICASCLCA